jgi:hypothetical protein
MPPRLRSSTLRSLSAAGLGLLTTAPLAIAGPPPLFQGPIPLKGAELGVGRRIPNLTFTDLEGRSHSLGSLGSKGVVLAMTSASCPVSKRYLPSLARLSETLPALGISLILINPFPSENPDAIRAQIQSAGLRCPYIVDQDHQLSRTLGATSTTEVFLLDATQTLLYRGALDDQYGTDYSRERPALPLLQNAVNALLAGSPPRINATSAPGCELDLQPPAAAIPPLLNPTPTYYRDVARILQHHCVRCHHDDGIAPFALDTLDAVVDRAKAIRRVVSERTMPPWHAIPSSNAPSPWANDCSLPKRDLNDLLAWIDSPDRPLGSAAEAPLPQVFPSRWSIGTPDARFQISRPQAIPATGTLPYQIDTVETNFPEDRWVSAYEILPTAREVVHHVLIQIEEPSTLSGKRAQRVDGAESFWGAYVPGNGARIYPDSTARRLPAGTRLRFQIHYTPSGKPTTDQLELGLLFAKNPTTFEVKTAGVSQRQLKIPPMAADHVESKSRRAPADLWVFSLMPHLHSRGKSFQYTLHTQGSSPETLLEIPRYDFNWQRSYEFKTPRFIPKGSELTITAHFDNSPANKANPDPSKTVTWGEQTSDEMMIGYLEHLVPVPPTSAAAQHGAPARPSLQNSAPIPRIPIPPDSESAPPGGLAPKIRESPAVRPPRSPR